MRLPKLTSLAIAAVCSVSFLAACASNDQTAPSGGEPPASKENYTHYVALGDSFASMASDSNFDGQPECMRSTDNYTAVVAADPRITNAVDVSCSGATTDDFSRSQFEGVPPQYEALTEHTDLITVSIGGNDTYFGDIIDCIREGQDLGQADRQCSETEGPKVRTAIDTLPAKLNTMYAEIAALAPNAHVIATGYMSLVPDEDEKCTPVASFSDADFAWALHVNDDINNVIRAAAEANGATYVLPADSTKHTGCASVDQRWTDFTGEETNSFPMHPTATGQKAMGEAILGALQP